MGGSEYRNTTNKIEQHRITARNIINTPTPQDLLDLNVFFFFFLNVPLLLLFKHKKHITRQSYRLLRM